MRSLSLLTDRAKKVGDLLTNLDVISTIIQDNDTIILDMNTELQLKDEGVNTYGVPIMDYKPYTDYTIQIKKLKGQPYNRVTLTDEGDFTNSFYLEIGSDNFEIKASDEKTEKLISKYGREILGLTDENLNVLIWHYVYPELLGEVKKVLING